MKLFEVKIDATEETDESSDKIDQIIYSLVDFISELECEGRVFKIIIEDVDDEVTDNKISKINNRLH